MLWPQKKCIFKNNSSAAWRQFTRVWCCSRKHNMKNSSGKALSRMCLGKLVLQCWSELIYISPSLCGLFKAPAVDVWVFMGVFFWGFPGLFATCQAVVLSSLSLNWIQLYTADCKTIYSIFVLFCFVCFLQNWGCLKWLVLSPYCWVSATLSHFCYSKAFSCTNCLHQWPAPFLLCTVCHME